MAELFDMELRALRRDRAARTGPALFLFDRVFEDLLERLEPIRRRFARALLIGCPDPRWPEQLRAFAGKIEVADPGALFALRAGGLQIVEDQWTPEESFDLVLAVGTLDTVNDLLRALRSIRRALSPDGLFLGAIPGGETLPRLRAAMRAADAAIGTASVHVHPRIEPSALAGLLAAAGFAMPVVDIDRVQVAYPSFERLVADLRAMGMTNILSARSHSSLSRQARQAAIESFATAGKPARTMETFEILHFAAWAAGTP